jgi:hypothetical protein
LLCSEPAPFANDYANTHHNTSSSANHDANTHHNTSSSANHDTNIYNNPNTSNTKVRSREFRMP